MAHWWHGPLGGANGALAYTITNLFLSKYFERNNIGQMSATSDKRLFAEQPPPPLPTPSHTLPRPISRWPTEIIICERSAPAFPSQISQEFSLPISHFSTMYQKETRPGYIFLSQKLWLCLCLITHNIILASWERALNWPQHGSMRSLRAAGYWSSQAEYRDTFRHLVRTSFFHWRKSLGPLDTSGLMGSAPTSAWPESSLPINQAF